MTADASNGILVIAITGGEIEISRINVYQLIA